MFAIDDPTASATLPTPEAAGTPGFWTEGNPALGQAATYVRASFLNGLQSELLNILTAAGVTPSKTTYNQLLSSFRSNGLLYAVDTGVANACVITFTPAVPALVDGMVLWFKAKVANTGVTTLNVNALGATPVVGGAHAALQSGEIIANGKCMVVYNATLSAFVLIECTGGALQVAPATQSQHAAQLGQVVGRLINVQVFSTAGTFTYTPTAGTTKVRVRVQGGGGAGGGVLPNSASQCSAGEGGGSGSYAESLITSGFSGALVTVGGVATGSAGNTGPNGNTSSFGALVTAPGGPGGAGGAGARTASFPSCFSSAVQATNATGGNLFLSQGSQGGPLELFALASGLSGQGGNSVVGGGGGLKSLAGGSNVGQSAAGFGAGGGGAVGAASLASNLAGGNGAQGLVIVEEFA